MTSLVVVLCALCAGLLVLCVSLLGQVRSVSARQQATAGSVEELGARVEAQRRAASGQQAGAGLIPVGPLVDRVTALEQQAARHETSLTLQGELVNVVESLEMLVRLHRELVGTVRQVAAVCARLAPGDAGAEAAAEVAAALAEVGEDDAAENTAALAVPAMAVPPYPEPRLAFGPPPIEAPPVEELPPAEVPPPAELILAPKRARTPIVLLAIMPRARAVDVDPANKVTIEWKRPEIPAPSAPREEPPA
jgi:hypothetical protein